MPDNARVPGQCHHPFGPRPIRLLLASALALVFAMALLLPACGGGQPAEVLPDAAFAASASSGQVPLTVTFTNQSVNAGEFRWDFGDGSTLTTTTLDEPVEHEYTASGTHTVTLTALGQGDPPPTDEATLSIEALPGPVTTVAIVPSPPTLAAAGTLQLRCVAADEYGNEVPGMDVAGNVTWILMDDDAGSLSSAGVFTAGKVAGDYSDAIEAAVRQGTALRTAVASVTITPGQLDQVVVAPDPVEIGIGMTQQLVAAGADRYGNRISGLTFTWSVDAEAGSIGASGLFTAGAAPGTYESAITAGATHGDMTRSGAADATVVPDRIAFISDREDDQGDVYTMELDGSNVERLTENPLFEYVLSWSPDGRRIAFDVRYRDENVILAMNDDGERMILLTAEGYEREPDWSPDGERIAYAGWSDDTESYEIFVMDVDGGNATQVSSDSTGDVYVPRWSPDGTRLAYDFTPLNGQGDIYVINADGTNPRRLTTDPANDTWPVWSPDGKKILFDSRRDGDIELYVMNADGTNLRQLTSNYGVADMDGCWSLDGKKIVFVSDRDTPGHETTELYMMDSDGGNVVRLTENDANEAVPQWAPRKQGVYVTEASVIIPHASAHKPKTVQQVTADARGAVVRIETDLGSGSGFFIDPDGLILTDSHVIYGAEEITVRLDSGQTYDGVVVARDKLRDLALVRIEASGLPYLEMGDVGSVDLGQQVLVLGYPLDKKKISVTSGFVSSIEYDGGINVTWIQTDSAINAGNSGGPLLSLQGDVIGMVAAKWVAIDVEGIGFAIGANSVSTYLPLILPEQG